MIDTERILIYLTHNKFKMLNKIKKVRKIVFTIYLITMLFIILMYFLGLTDESFQPIVTSMIKIYSSILVATAILFYLLEYIYRKK